MTTELVDLPPRFGMDRTAFDEIGTRPAGELRLASTVILARDAAGGVEVFLLERAGEMSFAGGVSVFPGGGVEPRDYHGTRAWRGPDPEWWGSRFGIDATRAGAAVRGVARELFEETGVLLAEPEVSRPGTAVAGTAASTAPAADPAVAAV